jgi:hypothetical protein
VRRLAASMTGALFTGFICFPARRFSACAWRSVKFRIAGRANICFFVINPAK